MANRKGKKKEVVTDFIFLGSRITADGDCSHEIKRLLLLGRKTMTNLDRVLKNRYHFADKGLYSQSYVFIVGFPCDSMVKNPPVNAEDTEDTSSIPGLGRSPGGGNSNSLHCSCLENPMDRGARWAIVHEVAKSQI